MKLKKVVALATAAVMSMAALTGCGNTDSASNDNASTTTKE